VVRIGDDNSSDGYGEWSRVSEIAEDGVLLVRPDGCIAWRRAGAPETAHSAQDELLGALRSVLSR
jgi:2,4-dichlorophenol 6-monooxygenase